MNHCIIGDCRDGMRELIAAGVQVNVITTSPPYWGLRDYGIPPSIWGGDPACAHEFADGERMNRNSHKNAGLADWSEKNARGGGHKAGLLENSVSGSSEFCVKCNAWKGCLGLEPDMHDFIAHITEVFSIARDLLADDGTLWVNMGDSSTGGRSGGGISDSLLGGRKNQDQARLAKESWRRDRAVTGHVSHKVSPGLKPKDLCMIPARVAIALQESGWYLRSQIPWVKRNCMPESAKDRPTNAVEYVYLFSKSKRYFFDAEPIKIAASKDTHARYARGRSAQHKYADGGPGDQTITRTFDHMKKPVSGWDTRAGSSHTDLIGRYPNALGVNPKARIGEGRNGGIKQNESFAAATSTEVLAARNRRNSDWFFESWQGMLLDEDDLPMALVINGAPYKGAHFATYPTKLIEPMILAGTSAHGHCPKCGCGWKRVKVKGDPDLDAQRAAGADVNGEYHGTATKEYAGTGAQDPSAVKARTLESMRPSITTGWEPTCECELAAVPAVVYDPFFGSGTTGQVAQALGRNWLASDMSTDYSELQKKRTAQPGLALA